MVVKEENVNEEA